MMSHSFNPVSRPSRPDGRVGASRGVSLEPSRRGGAALELAIGKLFSALARTTVGVMSRAIARRANVAAYLSRCGWDVDRAATASLVAFARSSSTVKPGTDFKVPPPPVTSEAIGTGGRSSFSGITCTVFGATGFLGRYVTHHVAKSGSRMILLTRCGENDRQHLKVMGDLGQIVQLDYNIRDEEAIRYAVERSNVVINMVGREWETRNFSFDDVHVTFPKKLAEICADVGVRRLIHVSALGADEDHPSAYYRTKAAGEAVVREAFPSATIVRPAKMVGVEDRFLNVFGEHSRKYPAVPIIDGGDSKHQPVFVDDVAVAVRQIVHDELTCGKTYELAGNKEYTVDELAKLVLRTTRSRRSTAYIPGFIMRALSCPHEFLLRRVPFPLPTPLGLTRSYIDAQGEDYLKQPDSLGFSDLGIEPNDIEKGYILDYLRSFRAGGYQVGEAPWEQGNESTLLESNGR